MFNPALGNQLRKQMETGRVLAKLYPQMVGLSIEHLTEALERKGKSKTSYVTVYEMWKKLNGIKNS